jgi:hypothetical protein
VTVHQLARPLLDELVVGALAGAAVALLLAILAHVRVSRVRRGFAALEGPDGRQTVVDAVARSLNETQQLRSELAKARSDLDAARGELADALRHVSVVRYDAFGDMGGRLSFTAALLDDSGDGLVLTSIHGRSEARTYAKGVKAGASDVTLSPEEQQAITLAMRGPGRG